MKYSNSEYLDRIIIFYLSIRIILLFIIFIFVLPQTIFELRDIIKSTSKVTPKFIALVSLTFFPILRVFDQLCYLYTEPISGIGSYAWYFGVSSTYFLFVEWIFIGCHWIQWIYSEFAYKAEENNSRRCWLSSILVVVLLGFWDIGILIGGYIDPIFIAPYYRGGFFVSIIILGVTVICHGAILAYHFKKKKKEGFKDLDKNILSIQRLSTLLAFMLVVVIIRDLTWYILKLPHSSPYRHICIFMTSVFEVAQSIIVMDNLSNSGLRKVLHFKKAYTLDDNASLNLLKMFLKNLKQS